MNIGACGRSSRKRSASSAAAWSAYSVNETPKYWVSRPLVDVHAHGQLRDDLESPPLGVDCLEHSRHFGHLAVEHVAKYVAIEVDHAALPVGLGKHLRSGFNKSSAGVGDDQPNTLERLRSSYATLMKFSLHYGALF